MKQHTTEILESIINNTCKALEQIADTDTDLLKMKRNYIIVACDNIKKMPLSKNKFLKLNILLSGTFEDLNQL